MLEGRQYQGRTASAQGRHGRGSAGTPAVLGLLLFPIRTRWFPLAVTALLIASGSAVAHHSFAMFDKNKKVELTGVVTRFEWTNPHSYIVISVNDHGKAQEWTIETGAPGSLIRLDDRWRGDIIKPGETVKLIINPLKSGQPGGALVDLITPRGLVLGQHAPKPNVAPLKNR
jgi:Family of unknown function (DUF6152)